MRVQESNQGVVSALLLRFPIDIASDDIMLIFVSSRFGSEASFSAVPIGRVCGSRSFTTCSSYCEGFSDDAGTG